MRDTYPYLHGDVCVYCETVSAVETIGATKVWQADSLSSEDFSCSSENSDCTQGNSSWNVVCSPMYIEAHYFEQDKSKESF